MSGIFRKDRGAYDGNRALIDLAMVMLCGREDMSAVVMVVVMVRRRISKFLSTWIGRNRRFKGMTSTMCTWKRDGCGRVRCARGLVIYLKYGDDERG